YQLPQAAGKAVVAVHHDGIHQPLAADGKKPVQLRTAFLGAADPAIYVFAGNGPAAAPAVLAQLPQLHLRVLAVQGGNPGIKSYSRRGHAATRSNSGCDVAGC